MSVSDPFKNLTDAQIIEECTARIVIRKEMLANDMLSRFSKGRKLDEWTVQDAFNRIQVLTRMKQDAEERLVF